ncbi:MAG: hypothetical protein GC178_10080 [Flavobacteriales bacterium]|nr:hypothetical protein [Flavobacteriales bacterium]
MKKQESKTAFNFSFADLEQLGDKADDLMDRDAAELLDYGVDGTYRTDLAAKTQALKDYPTDEELQGIASEATENKDAAADALKVSIRSIMVRVKQVFPVDSAKYNRFGTKGLDDMSDNDLVRCGGRVSRVATQYLTELGPKGVTAAMITDLDTLTTALDDAIDAQDTANRARHVATQERVDLANDLYANIVELFDFGKDHWITRNEAKYSDYIIYNVPGGGATPPVTVLTGTVAPNTTANVASDIAPDATITVKNTGTVPFKVCGSATATDPCVDGQTVNAGEQVAVTGNSTASGPLPPFLNISNSSPDTDAQYEVTISG